jgi:hypothetical protein
VCISSVDLPLCDSCCIGVVEFRQVSSRFENLGRIERRRHLPYMVHVKRALAQVRRTQADGDPNVPIIPIACISRIMGTCPCMQSTRSKQDQARVHRYGPWPLSFFLVYISQVLGDGVIIVRKKGTVTRGHASQHTSFTGWPGWPFVPGTIGLSLFHEPPTEQCHSLKACLDVLKNRLGI